MDKCIYISVHKKETVHIFVYCTYKRQFTHVHTKDSSYICILCTYKRRFTQVGLFFLPDNELEATQSHGKESETFNEQNKSFLSESTLCIERDKNNFLKA